MPFTCPIDVFKLKSPNMYVDKKDFSKFPLKNELQKRMNKYRHKLSFNEETRPDYFRKFERSNLILDGLRWLT